MGAAIGAHRRRWGPPFGAHRREDRLSGMGKPPWVHPSAPTGEGGASHLAPTGEVGNSVGPAILRPQEKVGPSIGAHRTLVRPDITELTVRSAIGTHKILVRDAMRRSQCHRRRWGPPFGAHRREDRLSGMGKPPWVHPSAPTGEGGASHLAPTGEVGNSVGPAILRPQEKVGPSIGAHRTLVRPDITELTVRSAIGTHKILVRDAMRRSQ